MRTRILYVTLTISLLLFPLLSYSKGYLTGWIMTADNFAPDPNSGYYHPYTLQNLKKLGPVPERKIVVDPRSHTWKAYAANGKLLRSGLATAGSRWCWDIHRPCKTRSGTFRIYSLGSSHCISHKFPVGRGGAPMPYCMFFNGGQGIHGSYEVVAGNISHGCVRVHVNDARWIRFNFATEGTKIIVKPY